MSSVPVSSSLASWTSFVELGDALYPGQHLHAADLPLTNSVPPASCSSKALLFSLAHWLSTPTLLMLMETMLVRVFPKRRVRGICTVYPALRLFRTLLTLYSRVSNTTQQIVLMYALCTYCAAIQTLWPSGKTHFTNLPLIPN